METLSKKESESASEVAFSKCSPPSRMHARQNVWSTNGKHRQGCVFSRVVINSPSRRGQAAAGARWQLSRCPPPHEVSPLARASGTYHQWCRYEHHHHPYSVSWQTQRQAGGRGCGPPCLAPPLGSRGRSGTTRLPSRPWSNRPCCCSRTWTRLQRRGSSEAGYRLKLNLTRTYN